MSYDPQQQPPPYSPQYQPQQQQQPQYSPQYSPQYQQQQPQYPNLQPQYPPQPQYAPQPQPQYAPQPQVIQVVQQAPAQHVMNSNHSSTTVVVNGNRPAVNHCCHCLLTTFTGGLWFPIWVAACCGCCCERPCG